MAATTGNLDGFDGEPDQAYIEDIQAFMKRTFRCWDSDSTRDNYLQWGSDYFVSDFAQKFPFVVHRFDEKTNGLKHVNVNRPGGAVETRNTPSGVRPDVYGTSVVHDAKVTLTSDPHRTTEELQRAQVKLEFVIKTPFY